MLLQGPSSGGLLSTPGVPGGRLSNHATEVVPLTTTAGATTIRYFPYHNDRIMLRSAGVWAEFSIGTSISNVLANSATGSAGPAAAANNSIYDLFVWSNAGVVTLTRGPAWTNDTTRSAGTALVRVDGVWMNNAAITNGPGASLGRYVGSIRTNGSATVDWIVGGTPGTAAVFGVFNAYNRVLTEARVAESTVSWNYTTTSWRALNGGNLSRVSYLLGLAENPVEASPRLVGTNSTGTGNMGAGYDWTSGAPTPQGSLVNGTLGIDTISDVRCDLGFHYFQMVEIGPPGGTNITYGSPFSGMIVRVWN